MQWRQARASAKNESGTGASSQSRHLLSTARRAGHPIALSVPAAGPVPGARALRGARTNRVTARRRRGAPLAGLRRADTACVFTGFYCGHLKRAFAGRQSWRFGFRGECSCSLQLLSPAVPGASPFSRVPKRGTTRSHVLALYPGTLLNTPAPQPNPAVPALQSTTAKLMPRNLTRACSGLAALAADAGG